MLMRRLIMSAIALIFIISGGISARAIANESRFLESVVSIGTRSQSDVANQAQAIDILSESELQEIALVHIQEAMLRVPGANLQRGNGQEYLPALRSPVLTGGGACGAILTMEDNIPLRPSGFCNVNELFEAHTEQARQIEVLRGPGTAYYGSNALHGMINVVTHKPDSPGGKLGLDVGPNDFVRGGLSQQFNDAGIKATLTHDGGYRDDSGLDQQKLSLWRRHKGVKRNITYGATFTNLSQETAGYILGKDSFKNRSTAKMNFDPVAYRDASAGRIWMNAVFETAGGNELRLTPFARYSDMDFLLHFLPGDPLEENGQRSVGLQSLLLNESMFSENNVRIYIGLDLEYTDAFLKQTQALPTSGSNFLMETVPQGKQYDYEVSSWLMAPFINLEWQITDVLQLVVGLRYERLEYDYDNRMLSGRAREDGSACGFGGCRYTRPDDRSDSFENVSPNIGLIWDTSEYNQVYLNIASGFRAPQATELYRLQRDQEVANLSSEQLDSIAAGFRGRLYRVSYDVSTYLMRKENFIFRDSDFFNVSNGKTDHKGLELQMAAQLADGVGFSLNASYAKHSYDYHQILNGVDISGNDIDTAPELFGSLQLSWEVTPHIHAELEWVHMDEYYMDPENLHQYEGHNLFNARVAYTAGTRWSISARVMNLADAEYAERADFTSFTQERYFPGEPVRLLVGFTMKW